MQEYVVNPFVWWYGVFCRNAIKNLFYRLVFLLNVTKTLPMVKNLFVPLFGDNSKANKAMSFVIRSWWVFLGTLFTLVMIIPRLIFTVFWIVLPFLPIVQTLFFLIRLE